MMRWTPRILVCLFLGAVTTVAVAWGIAWTSGEIDYFVFSDWRDYVHPSDGSGISILIVQHRGSKLVRFTFLPEVRDGLPTAHFRNVPRWAMRWADRNALPPLNGRALDEIEIHGYGYPSAALVLTVESTYYAAARGSYLIARENPPRLKEPGRIPNHLPLLPIWPGFLIDTLFYAAIWLGVFFGFTSAKWFLRAKRGRCPRCGYDLRGQRLVMSDQRLAKSDQEPATLKPQVSSPKPSSGCPECGWNREETEPCP